VLFSRRVVAAASSVVLALGITACNTDQIGAAAVVGDHRITVTDLQDHAREVVAVQGGADATGDQRNLQMTLLYRMIAFELRDHIAADAGITVTEAQVDKFIADQLIAQVPDGDLTPLLAQNAMTEESLREAVREVLISEQMGGRQAYDEAMMATSEKIGVEVNPRFGNWTGAGIEEVSGSISVPAGGEQDPPTEELQPDQ
jgi:SurA N-terminal domain